MLGQKARVGTVLGAVGKQVTSAFSRTQRSRSRSSSTPAGMRSDPITRLFSSIRHLLSDRQNGVVLHIVSASDGEGASSVAEALAKVATETSGIRVLLLDGSTQVAGIRTAHRRGGALATGALGEPLPAVANRGVAHLQLAINVEPQETDPAALYPDYRGRFDLTIIDCPSIASGRYSDLAPEAADGVILVVEAEKMRPIVLQRVTQMIKEQGGKILGIVLNKSQRYIPDAVYRFI